MRRWFSRSRRVFFRNHKVALFSLILLCANSRAPMFRVTPVVSDYENYISAAQKCAAQKRAAPGQPFLPRWAPPARGYPPGAGWLLCAPLALGAPIATYRRWFRVEMALFDFATLFAVTIAAMRMRPRSRFAPMLAIGTYGVLGALIPGLLYNRFDLAIALTVALGVLTLLRRNWLFLPITVAGTLIKLVPAMFALPALGAWLGVRLASRRRNRMHWLLVALAIALLATACWWLLPDAIIVGVKRSIRMHIERLVQIESVWALPYVLSSLVGWHPFALTNHGSAEVRHCPRWFLLLAETVPFAALFACTIAFCRRGMGATREVTSAVAARYVVLAYLSSVALFLATQRVLSPQFIIWLLPVCAIWMAYQPSWRFAALALGIFVLTFVEFDLGYWEIVTLQSKPYLLALILRNVALVALLIHMLRRTGRMKLGSRSI